MKLEKLEIFQDRLTEKDQQLIKGCCSDISKKERKCIMTGNTSRKMIGNPLLMGNWDTVNTCEVTFEGRGSLAI